MAIRIEVAIHAFLLASACSSPGSTNDGGADAAIDSAWMSDPSIHVELLIRQSAANGGKTTVSATITNGAKCTVEEIPAIKFSDPGCTWRSCDPNAPGTPFAIGDIVVKCFSGSVTLKASGNVYVPVDYAGILCPAGKINIGVAGAAPSPDGDSPGFATINFPNLTTSTTFAISGGFSIGWSDTTTSDIVVADFVGKGADGSNGDLNCGMTSVASGFSIAATTLSRLAPGTVAFTGGTGIVSGAGTNFVVTLINVGADASGNDETANVTLQ
jgi:hypothetical protein